MDNTELSRLAAEVTTPPPVHEGRGLWQTFIREWTARWSTTANKAETEEIYAQGDKRAAHLVSQQFVLRKMLSVQESERLLHFLDLLETVPADLRAVPIEQELKSRTALLALEKVEAEREAVRNQTTATRSAGLIPPEAMDAIPEETAEPPAIEPFITSEQIEATSTRLFRRYCVLPPAKVLEELGRWSQAMRRSIPGTVIAEITQNVERKLHMLA
jgi:hypothetical protein